MAECETRNCNKELTKTLSTFIFIQTLIIVETAKTNGLFESLEREESRRE